MQMTVQQMVDELSKYQPDLVVEIDMIYATVCRIVEVETSMGEVRIVIVPNELTDND